MNERKRFVILLILAIASLLLLLVIRQTVGQNFTDTL
jgi:hypothetical protein